MFRRRSAGATDGTAAQDPPVNNRPPAEAGKGRPTPKRSEAEKNRYTPITGARAGSGRAGSTASRTERTRRYDAMKSGEEWALNVRDKGPVKRLARDYVDSKRRLSEYYLYAMVVLMIVLFAFSKNPRVSGLVFPFLLVFIVALVVDGFFIRRGIRRLAAERLPGESTSGLTMYAVMRSMQIRRMRVPKPQVQPGDKI